MYQLWSKTTHAGDRYWDYQDNNDWIHEYNVAAVGKDDERMYVGAFAAEADVDFVTAMHGCFPDLYRLVLSALDEADRADYGRDSRECRIAELEMALAQELMNVAELQSELEGLRQDLEGLING